MSSEATHRLLQRQIKRYFGDIEQVPEAFQGFIAAVNDAYIQADADRTRLERTLELSSQELLQANADMQALLETVESQVEQRTIELTCANAELEETLTELQQTQSQLIQTEKMSSLGQLVAGVAHEINNPVSFIHGNLGYATQYAQTILKLIQLYQTHYPEPVAEIAVELEDIDLEFMLRDFTKLLSSMQVGADRIKQIVLSLRNFSRIEEADMKAVDIHEGIDSTLMMLQYRLKSKNLDMGIAVIKKYGDLPLVECYPGQLNQVFMNILANAIDALEESVKFSSWRSELHALVEDSAHKSKTLTQFTAEHSPYISIQTEQTHANEITIRIADNGSGVPEPLRQRLFDPFFTTKPIGKGTGLGLSISYQIIRDRHHGELICNSCTGFGTEFVIRIPLRQQPKLR